MLDVFQIVAMIAAVLTPLIIAIAGWYIRSVSRRQDEMRDDVRDLRRDIDSSIRDLRLHIENSTRELRESIEGSRREILANNQHSQDIFRDELKDRGVKLEETLIKMREISTLISANTENRADRDKTLNSIIVGIENIGATTQGTLNGLGAVRQTLSELQSFVQETRTGRSRTARSD